MRRFLITIGCIVLFTFPAITFAVDCTTDKTTGFVPLACYQGSALDTLYSENSLSGFFNKLFTFSLSIGAILAVVMIVWGGYLYMFKDSFASKLNAKEKITNAVIGLLLLLGIYLILYQINPQILNLNIVFPQGSGSASGPAAAQQDAFHAQVETNNIDHSSNPYTDVPGRGCYGIGEDQTSCPIGFTLRDGNYSGTYCCQQ